MQSKLLHQAGGQRIFAVILATGDEVLSCLQEFVRARAYSRRHVHRYRRFERRCSELFRLAEEGVRENPGP
jgi:uncharacterized protein